MVTFAVVAILGEFFSKRSLVTVEGFVPKKLVEIEELSCRKRALALHALKDTAIKAFLEVFLQQPDARLTESVASLARKNVISAESALALLVAFVLNVDVVRLAELFECRFGDGLIADSALPCIAFAICHLQIARRTHAVGTTFLAEIHLNQIGLGHRAF